METKVANFSRKVVSVIHSTNYTFGPFVYIMIRYTYYAKYSVFIWLRHPRDFCMSKQYLAAQSYVSLNLPGARNMSASGFYTHYREVINTSMMAG